MWILDLAKELGQLPISILLLAALVYIFLLREKDAKRYQDAQDAREKRYETQVSTQAETLRQILEALDDDKG